MHRIFTVVAAVAVALSHADTMAADLGVSRGSGLASKKGAATSTAAPNGAAPRPTPALLSTLVQTHTDERVPLDDVTPTADRWSRLLADRVTGEGIEFDPKLLGLLRALARSHPGGRIELVSGYRSAKLNEMMRKKGRHVAAHSQHSLGHAVDFRIVPAGETKGLDPRELEKEIRALGWEGGVGVYTLSRDWFVHADVGRNRRWSG